MTREISGLLWRIHSPSHLELVNTHNHDQVHLLFGGQAWVIVYRYASGNTFHRLFRTRADALGVLSAARVAK